MHIATREEQTTIVIDPTQLLTQQPAADPQQSVEADAEVAATTSKMPVNGGTSQSPDQSTVAPTISETLKASMEPFMNPLLIQEPSVTSSFRLEKPLQSPEVISRPPQFSSSSSSFKTFAAPPTSPSTSPFLRADNTALKDYDQPDPKQYSRTRSPPTGPTGPTGFEKEPQDFDRLMRQRSPTPPLVGIPPPDHVPGRQHQSSFHRFSPSPGPQHPPSAAAYFNEAPSSSRSYAYAHPSATESSYDPKQIVKDKLKLITQLNMYRSMGKKVREFNMNDDIEEIMLEIERHSFESSLNNTKSVMRKMLLFTLFGTESLVGMFKLPVKLQGFTDHVMSDIEAYDEIFAELHKKHGTALSPETRLVLTLIGSGLMYHMKKSAEDAAAEAVKASQKSESVRKDSRPKDNQRERRRRSRHRSQRRSMTPSPDSYYSSPSSSASSASDVSLAEDDEPTPMSSSLRRNASTNAAGSTWNPNQQQRAPIIQLPPPININHNKTLAATDTGPSEVPAVQQQGGAGSFLRFEEDSGGDVKAPVQFAYQMNQRNPNLVPPTVISERSQATVDKASIDTSVPPVPNFILEKPASAKRTREEDFDIFIADEPLNISTLINEGNTTDPALDSPTSKQPPSSQKPSQPSKRAREIGPDVLQI